LKSSLISRGKSVESLHGGSNVGLVELASSVLRNVGVAGLRVNTIVSNDVFEGIGHESSIASLVTVAVRAVHQVLLRETDEGLSTLKNVGSFKRSGGRERPARSALSLILDTGDGIRLAPINRGRESSLVGGGGDGSLGPGRGFPGSRSDSQVGSEVKGAEFLVGEVTEFVHGNSEALG